MNYSISRAARRRSRSVVLAASAALPLVLAPRLVHAAPAPPAPQIQTVPEALPRAARLTVASGRTTSIPLPAGYTWRIESGAMLVRAASQDGFIRITAIVPGEVILRVAPAADGHTSNDTDMRRYALRVLATSDVGRPMSQPETRIEAQMSENPPETTIPEGVGIQNNRNETTPQPATPNPDATLPEGTGTAPTTNVPPTTGTADNPPMAEPPVAEPPTGLPANGLPAPAPAETPMTGADDPRVSPPVPPPSRPPVGRMPFPTEGRLPSNVSQRNGHAPIVITQGLARLLTFPSNILAVFFSDIKVMDARAINARTVAVTGIGSGDSTLAVFTARYPGDAVGRANIFRISIDEGPKTQVENPADLEMAISGAIGDPRVRVAIIRSPRGNAVVRLSGTVHDANEVEAAKALAGLYVPPEQIISTLNVSPNAPTLDEALNNPSAISAGPELALQTRLRQLTSNDSIELVPLPTGLGLKATVSSSAEAEALLGLVPISPDRPVLPFIVIRGGGEPGGTAPNGGAPGDGYYQRAALTAEDQMLTRTLQSVTDVRTVYVTRTSQGGLAIYGTARNRAEYDAVRRYAVTLPQAGGINLAANRIYGGNQGNTGIQFFVRILDPLGQTIRRVNVETSVVEINRQAARRLGVQIGSVGLLSETTTGGGTVVSDNGTTVTNPTTTTRTIDPTFGDAQQGSFLLGNGFAGSGGLANLNPFRARIDALYSNGLVRILSQPNLSAVEGAEAQITIGGQRPVPSAAVSNGGGGGGTVGQSVEFRRFGIILTMRPTVTDDDTIILQIRADVTALDNSSGINLNGAFIPGETVRSIDTTITLHDGDTLAMGGLLTNDRRRQTSRIPILSQIPILGELFKSRSFEDNQTELAIFMTPRLQRLPGSVGTLADVDRVPALPPLPGVQQRNDIFEFSNAGSGASGGR